MTGLLATGFKGYELVVIDFHNTAFDRFLGNLMAALAFGVYETLFRFWRFEKMANETGLGIHVKMLFPFVVAVAEPARDFDAIHFGVDVSFVRKAVFFIFHRFFGQGFDTVTPVTEAGFIADGSIRFGAHTANQTVDGLSHAVDFPFNHTGKTGLDMTIQTVHFAMCGRLPTGIIGFHDMAGIAKAGLTGNHHKSTGRKNKYQ
jgi:hypothetical protein